MDDRNIVRPRQEDDKAESQVKDLQEKPLDATDAQQVRGGGNSLTNAWPSKLSNGSINSSGSTSSTSP